MRSASAAAAIATAQWPRYAQGGHEHTCRAAWSAGLHVSHEPTVGFPERSTPTTPRAANSCASRTCSTQPSPHFLVRLWRGLCHTTGDRARAAWGGGGGLAHRLGRSGRAFSAVDAEEEANGQL